MPRGDDILIAEIRAVSGRVEQHAADLMKMVQLMNLFLAGGMAGTPLLPPPPANDDGGDRR
jgi:hypothetical protein